MDFDGFCMIFNDLVCCPMEWGKSNPFFILMTDEYRRAVEIFKRSCIDLRLPPFADGAPDCYISKTGMKQR